MEYFQDMRKLLLLAVVLSGCMKSSRYSNYTPVFMERETFESSVKVTAPRPVKNPGNSAVFSTALYVVEQFEGIHIFNLSNGSQRGFLVLPGCQDVHVSGDKLFADSATDMVMFTLSNPDIPEENQRFRQTFSEYAAPDNLPLEDRYDLGERPENLVLVKWVRK